MNSYKSPQAAIQAGAERLLKLRGITEVSIHVAGYAQVSVHRDGCACVDGSKDAALDTLIDILACCQNLDGTSEVMVCGEVAIESFSAVAHTRMICGNRYAYIAVRLLHHGHPVKKSLSRAIRRVFKVMEAEIWRGVAHVSTEQVGHG